jgi:hypothetical protein
MLVVELVLSLKADTYKYILIKCGIHRAIW